MTAASGCGVTKEGCVRCGCEDYAQRGQKQMALAAGHGFFCADCLSAHTVKAGILTAQDAALVLSTQGIRGLMIELERRLAPEFNAATCCPVEAREPDAIRGSFDQAVFTRFLVSVGRLPVVIGPKGGAVAIGPELSGDGYPRVSILVSGDVRGLDWAEAERIADLIRPGGAQALVAMRENLGIHPNDAQAPAVAAAGGGTITINLVGGGYHETTRVVDHAVFVKMGMGIRINDEFYQADVMGPQRCNSNGSVNCYCVPENGSKRMHAWQAAKSARQGAAIEDDEDDDLV